MKPQYINIDNFSYELPPSRIANHPLAQRDESKLLVYQHQQIRDHHFFEIASLLPKNGLLVINNTKVIHARLVFHKETGSKIEVFCLEPINGSHEDAFKSRGSCEWLCMVGNAKKWKDEILSKGIFIAGKRIELSATISQKEDNNFRIRFTWNSEQVTFGDLLFFGGILPIPPYLNREVEASDEEQYQTTYAKNEGSVAAPTAGLHFTKRSFEELTKAGIQISELTLHVGAGTFRPVKAAKMEDHEMHREMVFISIDCINNLIDCAKNKRPVISVGTTSLRSIESLYWFGVKLIKGISHEEELDVSQWDPYELPQDVAVADALKAVIDNCLKYNKSEVSGSTQLLIAPGYQFKIADALLTNFHQPGSTLLLLVAAFAGSEWVSIYNHALTNEYRFLSFGDASLIFRERSI